MKLVCFINCICLMQSKVGLVKMYGLDCGLLHCSPYLSTDPFMNYTIFKIMAHNCCRGLYKQETKDLCNSIFSWGTCLPAYSLLQYRKARKYCLATWSEALTFDSWEKAKPHVGGQGDLLFGMSCSLPVKWMGRVQLRQLPCGFCPARNLPQSFPMSWFWQG